jgi:beta-N-acetylhexosaminidase
MRSLTLREKVAQLVIAPCYGENPNPASADYKKFTRWVRDVKVGGLIVLNRVVYGNVRNAEPVAMAAFLNQMQRLARVPLVVGADLERGASMRIANTSKFPHNMAYGAANDLKLTSSLGAAVARESRAMGIHWVFAPVADVNNNPDNPVIGIRSFGERPADVAAHVEAFIDGTRADPKFPVMLSVKHFPGHGDTAVDSHYGLGTIPGDRQRLDQTELVPFRAAIRKKVDAVMTAHLLVPGVEKEEIPATISPAVLTDLLRKDLGFEGLIVTDAMDMKGLTSAFAPGEAGVRALLAGVDILLMPANPEQVVDAVTQAVRAGRLSVARIDRSVRKILTAKARLGLQHKRTVDLEQVSAHLEMPEMEAAAQSAADKAVTLVRNGKDGVFPLVPGAGEENCLFVLTENRRNLMGMRLMQEAQARAPRMRVRILDNEMPAEAFPATAATNGCQKTVVAVINLPGQASSQRKFLDSLLMSHPVGLISLNSPYLLRLASDNSQVSLMATFSNTPVAEIAAVKAMFGEIAIQGRLPVTIPGLAAYGEGIQLPKAR